MKVNLAKIKFIFKLSALEKVVSNKTEIKKITKFKTFCTKNIVNNILSEITGIKK